MAFKPLVWYCRPVENGVWATAVQNAFGAYTPCITESLVVCISNLVLITLCLYRIWLTKKDFKVKRFRLRSNYYNYMLILMAIYSTAEPLYRMVMGISITNLDGQTGFAPFEMVSLVVEACTWCSMLIMLGIETKVYIHEFWWVVRFGVAYALIGDMVMLRLIFSVKQFYSRLVSPSFSVLYDAFWPLLILYISEVFVQVLFGVLLLVYVPSLDPYLGYSPIRTEFVDDSDLQELP